MTAISNQSTSLDFFHYLVFTRPLKVLTLKFMITKEICCGVLHGACIKFGDF